MAYVKIRSEIHRMDDGQMVRFGTVISVPDDEADRMVSSKTAEYVQMSGEFYSPVPAAPLEPTPESDDIDSGGEDFDPEPDEGSEEPSSPITQVKNARFRPTSTAKRIRK